MRSNILITGAGQLGSRYLQGLAKVSTPLNVYVQDISKESLERAKMRWEEVSNQDSPHEIFFIHRFDQLPASVDVAIVSTAAGVRPEVVELVANATTIKFWILEKVLAQNQDDISRIGSVVNNSKGAWVNTARRVMEWHQRIRSMISSNGPVILHITGGGWGLASNAVHFLDMLSWWTGEQLVHIDTAGLEPNWYESKRAGYFEISGTLIGRFSQGTVATLSTNKEIAPLKIQVVDHDFTWTIDESCGIARRSDGLAVTGQIDLQSTLTAALIKDILETGKCGLPTIHESSALHYVFLKALQEQWNNQPDKQKNVLPIT